MGTIWRRCIECQKRRARPGIDRCRRCHGQALLDQLDRFLVSAAEHPFHRWQHEHYGLTAETCERCQVAEQARRRLAREIPA